MESTVQNKLKIITNIPSPYRIHEFGLLNHELSNRGIEFEAIFLDTTERGRHWQFDSSQCDFPHRVARGWSFYIKGRPFLFNPGVWWDLLRRPPTWVLLGGMWYLPTIVGISLLIRLRQKCWLIGWNESTLNDQHHLRARWSIRLRQSLLRRYQGWVVPGQRAGEYVSAELVGEVRPLLGYANTVDELLYRDRVASLKAEEKYLRQKYRVVSDQRVLLWPARLSPEKGILPFLNHIQGVKGEYIILIAGEGPQRYEIEKWIEQNDFGYVRLLGHQKIDELLELYALADVLLLPSLSEPYGFAAVEALWAKLPLFLSERVGALPEVLQPSINGWTVDPDDQASVATAFQDMITCDTTVLQMMGDQSYHLAEKHFDSHKALTRFINNLLEIFPPKE